MHVADEAPLSLKMLYDMTAYIVGMSNFGAHTSPAFAGIGARHYSGTRFGVEHTRLS
jgi:hypothetical protein